MRVGAYVVSSDRDFRGVGRFTLIMIEHFLRISLGFGESVAASVVMFNIFLWRIEKFPMSDMNMIGGGVEGIRSCEYAAQEMVAGSMHSRLSERTAN